MTGKALIVARTMRDAHDLARDLDLTRGRYTVVTTVDTIRAVYRGTVLLAPNWERRFDKHAIKSHLRFTKLPVVDASDPEALAQFMGAEAPSDELHPDLAAKMAELEADPRGELTPRQLEAAHRYNRLRDEAPVPPVDAEEQAQYDAVASEAEGRALALADKNAALEAAPVDSSHGEPSGEAEQSEDPASATPVRRRSRCKQCNQLHYRDEECPSTEGDS